MKKKKIFKILSFILCIIMAVSVDAVGITVDAANGNNNPYSGGWQNCTWSVWEMVCYDYGIELPGWRSAHYWKENARNSGYSVGETPRANSIAVWKTVNQDWGHVALVTDVDFQNNQIFIKEGNYTDYQTGKIGYHHGWVTMGERNADGVYGPPQDIIGYIYLPKCEKPTISTSAVTGGKRITLYCATPGAEIYYTTDGSGFGSTQEYQGLVISNKNAVKYTGPFVVSSSVKIRTIAIKANQIYSDETGITVTIGKCATPVITETNTTGGKTVTLSCGTSGATIYYTTDGSTPTTSSAKYSKAITLTKTQTVKAIAVCAGYTNSGVASKQVSVTQVAAPTIKESNIVGGKTVTISSGLSGATIYYTTDGSTPTTSSAKYSKAITLTKAQTVKAMAVCAGYTNSGVASKSISVNQVAAPTITESYFVGGKTVGIFSGLSGATIYYTTDGSTPTTSSAKYSKAITLTKSQTVKAIAVCAGYVNSSVASKQIRYGYKDKYFQE